MKKITTVVRRLYKTPQAMEQTELLDFLVVLSLSDNNYLDFDSKSKAFIDEALDLIDEAFTGISKTVLKVKQADGEMKDVELSYFESIKTDEKLYNKTLINIQP
jgi:hypothetical protein